MVVIYTNHNHVMLMEFFGVRKVKHRYALIWCSVI